LQVSTCFQPVKGGQETYIENLCQILEANGYDNKVMQPYIRGIEDDRTIMQFHVPKGNWFMDSWFLFNLKLSFYKKLIGSFDVVISHYPFHYPKLKGHKRVIVISHGVDWHKNVKSATDKYRLKALELCKKRRPFIVANDTHFIRELGLDAPPR